MRATVANAQILPMLAMLCLESSASKHNLRAIGSRDAAPDEFPYIVRMEGLMVLMKDRIATNVHTHLCTATVLTTTWTLTAAHCVGGLEEYLTSMQKYHSEEPVPPKGIIRYTSVKGVPTTKDSYSDIVSTHNFPAYKLFEFEDIHVLKNDVSLMKTAPIQLDVYGKLSVVDRNALLGQRALAVGYGLTVQDGYLASTMILAKPLQVVEVMIKNCEETEEMHPALCMSRRCGYPASLCPGDSGGPLVHPSGVVAVNSRGSAYDCTKKAIIEKISSDIVGIVTPLSLYMDWITMLIKEDENENTINNLQ